MSQIEGTKTEVRFDQMAEAVTIRLDGAIAVTAEEVIRHLESDGLAPRTRKRLGAISQRASEAGTVIILRLRGIWESWIELDLLDALKVLFTRKGYQCA